MNDNTKALSKEFYFVFTCLLETKYPSLFFLRRNIASYLQTVSTG